MKHQVYSPLFRELQLIGQGTKDFNDFKWTLSFHSKFLVVSNKLEVFSF